MNTISSSCLINNVYKLVNTSRLSYAEYRQLSNRLFFNQKTDVSDEAFKNKLEQKYRSIMKNLQDEGIFVSEKGLLKFENAANMQRLLTDISNLISIGIKNIESGFSSATDQTLLKTKMRRRSKKPNDIVFYGVTLCEAYCAKVEEKKCSDTSGSQKVATKRSLTSASSSPLKSTSPKRLCTNNTSPERSVSELFEQLLEDKILEAKTENESKTESCSSSTPAAAAAPPKSPFTSQNSVIEYSQKASNDCMGIILPTPSEEDELSSSPPPPPLKKKARIKSKSDEFGSTSDYDDTDDITFESFDAENCANHDDHIRASISEEDDREQIPNVSNYNNFGFDSTIEANCDAKNAMDELFKHLNPTTLETYKNVNANFQKLVMIAQAQSEQLLSLTNYFQKHFKKINHLFVYNPKKGRWSLNCSGCPVHCPINISLGQRQKTLKTFNKTNKELQHKNS